MYHLRRVRPQIQNHQMFESARSVVSCTCVLQKRQNDERLYGALILCKYDRMNVDLLILSRARVQHCAVVVMLLMF